MEILKVVCLGDPTVKKTDLLSVLSEKQCKCTENSCIHNLVKDYFTCNRLISDKLTVEIRLFNTVDSDFIEAGNLRRMKYENADVMLLAFDVGDPDTFYSIEERWVQECLRYSKNAKILLIGVQSDMSMINKVVEKEITFLCTQQKLRYCEISLETKKNIEQCMTAIIEVAFDTESTRKKRTSIGDGFSSFIKKGVRILRKMLPEKQDEHDTDLDKKQDRESISEQSELHAIVDKHDSSTRKVPLFRARLQKKYTDIVATIKNENIVDHLITEDVLTLDDKDILDFSTA
ncbi:rho-related GTP-binding protein RhoN-like [Mytilus californianus]|uniref:rho-related GTP-binding protein RhoN-like n=1 Tax=Mytilus californianus TaxID=6549 RepID=UPI002247810F|nr:rho-related GTP-binding protein RhoN-like [Mytilus californianus]XP_052085042.1 rho-related GTP-binding protein RhoN-like [Mytilus californianus]XP_052085043.1 rho-related GTP-binding protein RhoN-like [Mytilus californianus]XP_052085044.1 rho-related GTP-binding protein RhoN-like [Mytilus californianus]